MKKIAIAFVVVIAGLVGYGFMQPSQYTVERSIVIDKPVDSVFAAVSDFKEWPKWSPWFQRDPQTKITYGDLTTGVGGSQAWDSASQGAGSQYIEVQEPNARIRHKLVFTRPFEDTAYDEFIFKAVSPTQTEVKWIMEASNRNFMARLMFGLLNVPAMIGRDFEVGLENLKNL